MFGVWELLGYCIGGTALFFVSAAFLLLKVGKGDLEVERYGGSSSVEKDESIQKAISKKLKLREKAQRLRRNDMKTGNRTELNKHGLPKGQVPSKKWIVLDLGKRPNQKEYSLCSEGKNWSLKFMINDSSNEKEIVVVDLNDLEQIGLKMYENVHWNCVTGWTYVGLTFQGVPVPSLLELVKSRMKNATDADEKTVWRDDWKYLYQTSPEGYSVPVFREDVENAFLCVSLRNSKTGKFELMDLEHGGIRFVFPTLFGWKSCKWVSTVRLLTEYRKGFWERIGCHARGRVEFDERWAPQASKVWNVLYGSNAMFLKVFGDKVGFFVMQKSGYYLGVCVDSIQYLLNFKKQE
mmetsp:Transcript_6044/g.7896  ORF Transcript_6044/g.7896 Transcript_6044/m.7896 type:complete len:350 (+) Transcript_6044:83-1132(+)